MAVSKKVMVVGQQTRAWGEDRFDWESEDIDDVDVFELQDGYRCFNFGRWYKSSPFWLFSHELVSRITGSPRVDAMLWNNIIKSGTGVQGGAGLRKPAPRLTIVA